MGQKTLSVSQKPVGTKNEAIKVRVTDVRLVKSELGFLLALCLFVCVLFVCLRFVCLFASCFFI